MSFISAVIPAAGLGRRMCSDIPKTLISIDKTPLFVYTLNKVAQHPKINEVILVASSEYIGLFKEKIKQYRIKKIKAVVRGGVLRQESVKNGLAHVEPKADFVLIHDAVRPFINLDLISRLISIAKKYGAVTLGVPAVATLKITEGNNNGNGSTFLVKKTLPRQKIWEIQTPQIFRKDWLFLAYQRLNHKKIFSDDAQMVEELGFKVRITRGSFLNIKITNPEDLILATALMRYIKKHGL